MPIEISERARSVDLSMLRIAKVAGALCGLLMSSQVIAGGYADHQLASEFVAKLEKEGFNRAELLHILSQAERKDSILEAMSRPAERRLTWGEYRDIFIKQARIQGGVAFWDQYANSLSRAEQQFGVPAEIIVAIIGVETNFGRNMGRYRVLDALATLGFDYPKRSEFFLKELGEYLRLTREEKVDPLKHVGSYAGAMGYGQFMPSSYRHYAIDFDGDGRRDIWDNPVDAIGSVANYFVAHGWKANGVAVLPVKQPETQEWRGLLAEGLKPSTPLSSMRSQGLSVPAFLGDQDGLLMEMETASGPQLWLGLHNFYVITRYNHSRLYALAVHELAAEIRNARANAKGG